MLFGDKVLCRECLKKGIKKQILINKTETCKECRSTKCKNCGVLTTSKVSLCTQCDKPYKVKAKAATRDNESVK